MILEDGTVVKTVMRGFDLLEISAVDRPAQPLAQVVILKRAPDKDGGEPTLPSDNTDVGKTTPSEDHMTKQDEPAADPGAAEAEAAEKIAELEKRAERAEKIAELTNDQRDFFKALGAEDQDGYLAKSTEARDADVQAAKAEDAVVYKAEDGTEFRKSDDPRLVQMAKAVDDERQKRIESEAKAYATSLEKRAEELAHLPDKDGARIALLKAVDTLPEAERELALAALRAHSERLGKAFQTSGTKVAPDPDTAELDSLEALAKRLQEQDPKLSFSKAYSKALETEEGAQLYAKTVEG